MTETWGPVFQARFAGSNCAGCHDVINIGDDVRYQNLNGSRNLMCSSCDDAPSDYEDEPAF